MALTRSFVVGAVLLAAAVSLDTVRPASAQVPFPGGRPLTGSIQCVLETMDGSGYVDKQTHTWALTGAPPSTQNAAEGTIWIHAARWSATGTGHHLTQSTSTSTAPNGQSVQVVVSTTDQWKIAAGPLDAPIAIRTRGTNLGIE